MRTRIIPAFGALLAVAVQAAMAGTAVASPSEAVLHSFGSSAYPVAGLLVPASGSLDGSLLGTTLNGGPFRSGAVFRLTPPQFGQSTLWTEAMLYGFKGGDDGANPDAALIVDASGDLYGTTRTGGPANSGTVFRLAPPAPGATAWVETLLHRFKGGNDGANPRAALVSDSTGALYGTTESGGRFNAGIVFKLTPPALGRTAWTETVLHSFSGGRDGARPVAGLMMDASGALYGTTGGGGLHDSGTVFKLTPPAAGRTAWRESVLYRFLDGIDGAHPMAALIADASGNLYGTTRWGGIGERGTVFRLAPPRSGQSSWTETVLYRFKGQPTGDGAHPYAALIADAGGTLYGTTESGGADLAGTVFKLTPTTPEQTAWRESVILSFTGGTNGAHPYAALAGDPSGTLDGTTGNGVVFTLTTPRSGQTAWTEGLLYSFQDANDGAFPGGGLIADASGALYGTTSAGGGIGCDYFYEFGCGTVYRLTPPAPGQVAWTETVLHSFAGGADGADPAGLVADASGALYGTTSGDTVFKLTPPVPGKSVWTETVIHRFDFRDGDAPYGAMIFDANGALYGTTMFGGQPIGPGNHGFGIVFRLAPPAAGKTAWTETVLHRFEYGDGAYPSALIFDATGTLYGTAQTGGITLCGGPGDTEGCGTIYRLAPPRAGHTAWGFSLVYSFKSNADGAYPNSLVADPSGALYGTTSAAGPSGGGIVFKLTPPASGGSAWTKTLIYSFKSQRDGVSPSISPIADASGALYGTAYQGRLDVDGTVFKLAPPTKGQSAWTKTVLYGFKGGADGAGPAPGLLLGSSGALFGATSSGGLNGFGTVFELTP